jgi:uncharacterized membrane protein YccC
MADFDFGGAASGAASGAAAGSTFGPWGTAIGGAVGFLGGAFAGGDDDETREQAIRENRELLGTLRGRYEEERTDDPTDTALFGAGVSRLEESQDRMAREDAAQAAARGLEGSAFEVAQDTSRARESGRRLQKLLTASARADRQEEASARQAFLNQRSQLNALLSDRAQAQTRQSERQGQRLFSTFRAVGRLSAGQEEGNSSTGSSGGIFD